MVRSTSLTLGQVIALARKEAGLNQKELASELGLSYRSVQEWEGGRIDPTAHLREIEEVTGKPSGWISDQINPYAKVAEMAKDLAELRSDVREILALLRQR